MLTNSNVLCKIKYVFTQFLLQRRAIRPIGSDTEPRLIASIAVSDVKKRVGTIVLVVVSGSGRGCGGWRGKGLKEGGDEVGG